MVYWKYRYVSVCTVTGFNLPGLVFVVFTRITALDQITHDP